MGKLVIAIQVVFFFTLIVLLTLNSSSQVFLTKELKWESLDSISTRVFKDTDQIMEWGNSFGPFSIVKSEKFCINSDDVYVLTVDLCSGIYCPSIYVFKNVGDHWHLMKSSQASIWQELSIESDTINEKLIFFTKLSHLGDLPFKNLE